MASKPHLAATTFKSVANVVADASRANLNHRAD